ncbi:MAG: hypothetical protein ACD_12C00006G0001 [uncultured bacterium]|nr:MAG: hypothetical protein ACD_12C00006G0001 [uncultured bacterium]
MKDDKICFSKTFTYLVLLIAAVAGAFWVMNYVNSQNLGSTPRAAGDCSYRYKGTNFSIPNGTCATDVVTEWKTAYKCINGRLKNDSVNPCSPTIIVADCTFYKGGNKYTAAIGSCLGVPGSSEKCIAKGVVRKHTDCAAVVVSTTCTANIIASKALDGSYCRYNTGVAKKNNTCAVQISYDKKACTPAVGKALATGTAATICTANKISNVYSDGSCQFETGVRRNNGTCVYDVEADDVACAPGKGKQLVSGTPAVDWQAVKIGCEVLKGISFGVENDVNGSATCYVYNGYYSATQKTRSGNYCTSDFKGGSACQ